MPYCLKMLYFQIVFFASLIFFFCSMLPVPLEERVLVRKAHLVDPLIFDLFRLVV